MLKEKRLKRYGTVSNKIMKTGSPKITKEKKLIPVGRENTNTKQQLDAEERKQFWSKIG